MLARIKELLNAKNNFAFETTLSTKSYAPLVEQAKKLGYTVVLIYFWLESVELAKNRVKARVEKGGHNIPSAVIERRYVRGIENFFRIYQNLVDRWMIYDNSDEVPLPVAKGTASLVNTIYNHEIWNRLQIEK